MADAPDPRERDEWRVEVELDADEHGRSLGERLRSLNLDNEAEKRLGGSVVVTRDGPHLFLYAWHEESAQEAERVIRDLMEEDELSGEVSLTRWHPVEEAWRPASEPLPETDDEVEAERRRNERAEEMEAAEKGDYDWEVVIDLPNLRETRDLAARLTVRGLPVKRRFKYLLVGQPTEEAAIELGKSFEGEVPEGSHVGIRANPADSPAPSFVLLGSLKPGVMRDLGI
jgi:hypothetical protein